MCPDRDEAATQARALTGIKLVTFCSGMTPDQLSHIGQGGPVCFMLGSWVGFWESRNLFTLEILCKIMHVQLYSFLGRRILLFINLKPLKSWQPPLWINLLAPGCYLLFFKK